MNAKDIIEQRINELQHRIDAGDVASHLLKERLNELKKLFEKLTKA
jgi:DNA-binding HxlR family transcriptional regulator